MKNSSIIFLTGILLMFITGCESNDYTVVQSSQSSQVSTKADATQVSTAQISTKTDTMPSGDKLKQQKNQNTPPETPPPAAPEPKKTAMKKNPFLSWEEEQALLNPQASVNQTKKVVVLDSLKISAIFCSPVPAQSYAIVDGRIVRENDEIANKKIVQIKEEEIILTDKNAEYIVRLNPLKNKGQ